VSSNFPVTGGGGAVVSLPAGGVITEYGGDMSVDRGAPAGDVLAANGQRLHQEIQRALGVPLGLEQIQRAQEVLRRYGEAENLRQRAATNAAIHARWGAATEGDLIALHGWALATFGKAVADELTDARDRQGNALFNKLPVLEAFRAAARATPAASRDDGRGSGGAAPDPGARLAQIEARLREIDGWVGATKGSESYKKYWDNPKAQEEYRELRAEHARLTGQGVTPHSAADSDVEPRIAELDRWMGARKGSPDYFRYWSDLAVQREYATLLDRRERARK